MKFRTVLLFSGILITSACGPWTDGSETSQDALVEGDVCATLDYGPTVPAENYYRQFESDAAAGEYLRKLYVNGRMVGMSGASASFREISRDSRLVRLVDEVMAGFRVAFPREMTGIGASPRVAIVESEIVNAFALGPGFVEDDTAPRDKSPWLFIVHTALLNQDHTDTELRGLFAHELGHLVLRTFLPEIQRRVRSIYMTSKSEDGVLGAVQQDDPRIASHVERILKYQQRVNGLPKLGLPVLLDPTYFRILRSVTAPEPGAPSDPCSGARSRFDELAAAQIPLVPDADQQNYVPLLPTLAQQNELDALTNLAKREIRMCTSNSAAEGSLLQLAASLNSLPVQAVDPAHPQHAELLAATLETERRVDAASPGASLIERILDAEGSLRSELAALRDDPSFPIDQLRVFDYEEDADDASVRVLAAIGDEPTGLGRFFLSIMSEDARAKCIESVDAGRTVPYGQLIDTHPATCWRYYHQVQFAKSLNQCGADAKVRKKAPKGPGRASTLDTIPRDRVERGYGRGQR